MTRSVGDPHPDFSPLTVKGLRGALSLLAIPEIHMPARRGRWNMQRLPQRCAFAARTAVAVVALSLPAAGLRPLAAQEVGKDRLSPTGYSCNILTADRIGEEASLTAALRNGVPGVRLVYTSGQVGSGPRIRIRGTSTIHGTLDPLVFVDGVRISDDVPGSAEAGARAVQALDMIDPLDVLAMVVFSGPAGTALYGTDAAGGVIHVYLKRGDITPALEEDGIFARCGR